MWHECHRVATFHTPSMVTADLFKGSTNYQIVYECKQSNENTVHGWYRHFDLVRQTYQKCTHVWIFFREEFPAFDSIAASTIGTSTHYRASLAFEPYPSFKTPSFS